MIVLKFGGSSVEDAAAIDRVTGLVRGLLGRSPVIVVSAMAKTTRKLLESAEAAAAGNLPAALDLFEELREFHRREAYGVIPEAGRPAVDAVLDRSFADLQRLLGELAESRELTPRAADEAASHGEVMSSAILAGALEHAGVGADWVDCRRVLVTDDCFTRARPIYEKADPLLREALLPIAGRGRVPVLGGYVGSTPEGITTTLGKEGSDFSAAIVGAALQVEEIQIWTDVDGILTADPRLVPGARRIRTLSFAEALEIASSGGKKPHPGTLGPASRAGVPIRILNSRHPESEGTLIGRRSPDAPPTIKSIAGRSHDHLLYALPAGAEDEDLFLSSMLAESEPFRPSLMVLGTAEAAVHLALDRRERLAEVRAALGRTAELGVLRGRAVVSLVSEDLTHGSELAARVLQAARPYEPRLVVAGAACPVVRCLVEEEDMTSVIAELHERLLGGTGGVVE